MCWDSQFHFTNSILVHPHTTFCVSTCCIVQSICKFAVGHKQKQQAVGNHASTQHSSTYIPYSTTSKEQHSFQLAVIHKIIKAPSATKKGKAFSGSERWKKQIVAYIFPSSAYGSLSKSGI